MKKRRSDRPEACPCCSGRPFAECCGPFLDGKAAAPGPEALMRSRFTAYALRDDDYVLRTWAPETRPARLFAPGEQRPKWFSLKVLSASEEGDRGTVHYVALARSASGAVRLEEVSRFRREGGRWLYVDGTFPGEKSAS
jgi:SEC-C motif-containing protein